MSIRIDNPYVAIVENSITDIMGVFDSYKVKGTISPNIRLRKSGKKYLRMYAKGTFDVYIQRNYAYGFTGSAATRYTLADYTYLKIPVFFDENNWIEEFSIAITATTDCWFNKMEFDDL